MEKINFSCKSRKRSMKNHFDYIKKKYLMLKNGKAFCWLISLMHQNPMHSSAKIWWRKAINQIDTNCRHKFVTLFNYFPELITISKSKFYGRKLIL